MPEDKPLLTKDELAQLGESVAEVVAEKLVIKVLERLVERTETPFDNAMLAAAKPIIKDLLNQITDTDGD